MFQTPRNDTQSGDSFFNELVKVLLIALLVVIPIRIFIAQPFIVSGASMDPTFENGDYLIIDQISYRTHAPERLDVVIFKYPKDTSKYFIKRVIGLPGETVQITDGVVRVIKVDGSIITLDEPYVTHTHKDTVEETLSEKEYFVLGDNRAGSSDSRLWGPLAEKYIVGTPLVRLLPPKDIGLRPGKHITE